MTYYEEESIMAKLGRDVYSKYIAWREKDPHFGSDLTGGASFILNEIRQYVDHDEITQNFMQEVIDFADELKELGFLDVNEKEFSVFDLSRFQEAQEKFDDNSFHTELVQYLSDQYDLTLSFKSTDMGSILVFNTDDLCDDCDDEDEHLKGDCND